MKQPETKGICCGNHTAPSARAVPSAFPQAPCESQWDPSPSKLTCSFYTDKHLLMQAQTGFGDSAWKFSEAVFTC